MTPELYAIAGLPGVTGLCFHDGAGILHQNLPASWGPAAAGALGAAVESVFSGYAAAGRPLRHTYFQYPECGVLAVAGPERRFLTILVNDQTSLPAVIPPARAFLGRA